MRREEFIGIMERTQKKQEENENWYNDIEETQGDQLVSKIIVNNYFVELIDFVAAALGDNEGLISRIVESGMGFPVKIDERVYIDWGDVFDWFSVESEN